MQKVTKKKARKKTSRGKPRRNLTKEQENLSRTSKYTGAMIDVLLTGRYKRDGVTHEAGDTIKMHSDELAEKSWLCEAGMEKERAYQKFTETIGLQGPGRRIDAPGKP